MDKYDLLRDVPTEQLARNVVSSLILAKGNISLWDALILKLIKELREEYAEDLKKAKLYTFLRDEDAWGEDAIITLPDSHPPLSAWACLGELSGKDFDEFIELKMKDPEAPVVTIK